MKTVGATHISFADATGETIKAGGEQFRLALKKL
jgi:hypothetical protein